MSADVVCLTERFTVLPTLADRACTRIAETLSCLNAPESIVRQAQTRVRNHVLNRVAPEQAHRLVSAWARATLFALEPPTLPPAA